LLKLDRKAEAANAYQGYLDSEDASPAKRAEVTKVLAGLDRELGLLELDVTQSITANENASETGGNMPEANRRSRRNASSGSPMAAASRSRRTDHRRSRYEPAMMITK